MTNELHRALASRIMRHARTSGLRPGHHFTEASLQELLGISRGPIREALARLREDGVVEQVPNKGFFLVSTGPNASTEPLESGAHSDEDALYLAIADSRLVGAISETVSEPELMRRFNVSRPKLQRILNRIAAEGWIERREGRGWSFAQMIDSVEAYRESYELRQIIEPAGILGDGFRPDGAVLARLKQQQVMIRDAGWQRLSQIELFEVNSQFHEQLASMSNNRFLVATVQRQNQLRRLVEYRQTLNRDQVRGQNDEHLDILDALEKGNRNEAAQLLAQHLGSAKKRKARTAIFSPTPMENPDATRTPKL